MVVWLLRHGRPTRLFQFAAGAKCRGARISLRALAFATRSRRRPALFKTHHN
jgi:hypothetical protein